MQSCKFGDHSGLSQCKAEVVLPSLPITLSPVNPLLMFSPVLPPYTFSCQPSLTLSPVDPPLTFSPVNHLFTHFLNLASPFPSLHSPHSPPLTPLPLKLTLPSLTLLSLPLTLSPLHPLFHLSLPTVLTLSPSPLPPLPPSPSSLPSFLSVLRSSTHIVL